MTFLRFLYSIKRKQCEFNEIHGKWQRIFEIKSVFYKNKSVFYNQLSTHFQPNTTPDSPHIYHRPTTFAPCPAIVHPHPPAPTPYMPMVTITSP